MPAQISRIVDWDGTPSIIVPATDPGQAYQLALAALDLGETIITRPEEVTVQWWRVNPCSESTCDEGPHTGHWVATGDRKTRGGFQAAEIFYAYAEGGPCPDLSLARARAATALGLPYHLAQRALRYVGDGDPGRLVVLPRGLDLPGAQEDDGVNAIAAVDLLACLDQVVASRAASGSTA